MKHSLLLYLQIGELLRELEELRDQVRSLQKRLDNEKRDREQAQARPALLQAEIAVTKESVNNLYFSQYT